MEPAGFHLALPTIFHQSHPGSFDELPRDFLTDTHRALNAWLDAGGRFLLAYFLPVWAPAQDLALALLWKDACDMTSFRQ